MPKPPMAQGRPHDFQTADPMPVEVLSRYIPKSWVVWECASGKGFMVENFKQFGYTVIPTDILTGQDFLMYPHQNATR